MQPLNRLDFLTDRTPKLLSTLRAIVAVAATVERLIPTPTETPAEVPPPPTRHRSRAHLKFNHSPTPQMEGHPLVWLTHWNTL
eukprot:superscaffoldBa00003241_g16458